MKMSRTAIFKNQPQSQQSLSQPQPPPQQQSQFPFNPITNPSINPLMLSTLPSQLNQSQSSVYPMMMTTTST